MIHIITVENRHLFRHALMEMHRQRKTVFIDQLGWNLEAAEGLEIDAYDAEEAIYLIEADAPRAPVRASLRLLATDRPHLMSDIFPSLCAGGVPRAANIWEVSRFCAAPGTPREERRGLLMRMIAGVLETGLLFGLRKVTFVLGSAIAPLALKAGWRISALGERQIAGDDEVQAFAVDVDAEGLEGVRQAQGFSQPLTRFMPGQVARVA